MSDFPLYTNLISGVKSKDLTVKEKEQFISMVQKLDENGKELFYVLIYHFAKNNCVPEITQEIPFNGTKKVDRENADISWDLNAFPVKLKQLLFKFLNKHMEKIKEDMMLEFSRVKIEQ